MTVIGGFSETGGATATSGAIGTGGATGTGATAHSSGGCGCRVAGTPSVADLMVFSILALAWRRRLP
ncbi:MAG: hypothetical protein WCG85_11000 [Polyangia bacterium]